MEPDPGPIATRHAPVRRAAVPREALYGAAAGLAAGASVLAALGALCAVTLFGVEVVLAAAGALALLGGVGGVVLGARARVGDEGEVSLSSRS
jgi:uncharacterized membrane protein